MDKETFTKEILNQTRANHLAQLYHNSTGERRKLILLLRGNETKPDLLFIQAFANLVYMGTNDSVYRELNEHYPDLLNELQTWRNLTGTIQTKLNQIQFKLKNTGALAEYLRHIII